MMIKMIDGCTRNLNAPENWDGKLNGHCGVLPVADVVVSNIDFMVSAWEPTPYELELLNKGANIHLYISGHVHPVVSVCVSSPPKE